MTPAAEQQLLAENARLRAENELLRQKLDLVLRKLFGAKSEALDAAQPADIVILPWNIRDEVVGQLSHLRARGARFVTAIPSMSILG